MTARIGTFLWVLNIHCYSDLRRKITSSSIHSSESYYYSYVSLELIKQQCNIKKKYYSLAIYPLYGVYSQNIRYI